MPKEWQFIPTRADGKAKDDNARTLVRKTALRTFHRNKRLDRMSKFGTNESQNLPNSQCHGSTQVNWQLDSTLPDRTTTAEEQCDIGLQWRATLVDIGPAATFDPFVSTTLYSNRDNIKMFTHCK
jgi:hypothetical protein